MRKLFEAIKNFFNQPDRMYELEMRFYAKLKDRQNNPEKYKRLNSCKDTSKIPPVSLF